MKMTGEAGLAIQHVHTYLVRPRPKLGEKSRVTGTKLELKGPMFEMLEGVYEKSERECNIDIAFSPAVDGTQTNDCRNLMLAYVRDPTVTSGRALAARLEQFTTRSSGHGLLFLIAGKEGRDEKILISRFPADNGILAEENQSTLNVEFLERIFMKSAFSYKAALYQDSSLVNGFWDGKCIDKQTNDPIKRISDYWINHFLSSNLRVTAAAGTHRLATAIRNATKAAKHIAIKEELVAVVALAKGLKGKRISINSFSDQFGLSKEARDLIVRELPNAETASETFQFDLNEFTTQLAYRSVELDTGAIVTAEASKFEEIVRRQRLEKEKIRLSVEGKVLNERLKKAS